MLKIIWLELLFTTFLQSDEKEYKQYSLVVAA